MKQSYAAEDIHEIRAILEEHQTFKFPTNANGLFPAGKLEWDSAAVSGYQYVWVRDNVYIAYAHYVNDLVDTAVVTAKSLASYFRKYQVRFDTIINGPADAHPMKRPHIRFDGARLEELQQKWAHAQNDALGYFLWFYCKLAHEGALRLTAEDMAILGRFVSYFQAIEFWQDEDSGHWEEIRKIGASSIGVVVGALQQLKTLLQADKAAYELLVSVQPGVDIHVINGLLKYGWRALRAILPRECVQKGKKKYRPYDAALLFLIYPIGIVNSKTANQIIANVANYLKGEYGIRRYTGDSYWCANYKELVQVHERTKDFSDELEQRDALVKESEEAQWCIFDPILSSIYGQRYCLRQNRRDLQQQILYLNRSLGQVTEDFKCPEAYYLEHGQYVPNDHTPLLWTQANLWLALKHMEQSLTLPS